MICSRCVGAVVGEDALGAVSCDGHAAGPTQMAQAASRRRRRGSSRRRSSSSRSWPGSSASRSRSIAVTTSGSDAFALEPARRAHQVLRARRLRGRRRACGPATRRPAGRRAAATSRPGRRVSSSRSASSDSAVETVGRRAPTNCPRMRWVSASGTITPSPETRPQRSARCQNSAFRRRSTRVSWEIAWVVASRSERSLRRSNSDAVISGYRRHLGREAAVEHGHGQRREHGPDGVDRAAGRCG